MTAVFPFSKSTGISRLSRRQDRFERRPRALDRRHRLRFRKATPSPTRRTPTTGRAVSIGRAPELFEAFSRQKRLQAGNTAIRQAERPARRIDGRADAWGIHSFALGLFGGDDFQLIGAE